MPRCRSAEVPVPRCRGAEVQRCRSAEVSRCRSVKVSRCRGVLLWHHFLSWGGAEVPRCRGVEVPTCEVPRCSSPPVKCRGDEVPKGRGVKVSSRGLPWPPVAPKCRRAEVPSCRSAEVPGCQGVVPWHLMSPPVSFRCLSWLPMKCRGAEVQNVEALQCHPIYAFMGGGASDGLKSMVSQKVLNEKQRITYQKHLALSSPSARSVARLRSTKKIYTFIYRSIVLHWFYRGEIVYLFKICGFPLVLQQQL